jgi:multiple sugar transport system permease protein
MTTVNGVLAHTSRGDRGQSRTALLMLSPSLLLYAAFVAVPVLGSLTLAFVEWDLLTPPRFVGFENFARLAGDATMLRATVNTFVFAIATVIIHLVGAVALALALNRPMNRLVQKFTSAAIFFPVLLSWSAVALLWKYVLDPNFGFVNHYLGELGISAPNWFADENTALLAMIGLDVWQSLGYTMVIILAGLQGIQPSLYEAAKLDGAGPIRQFWSVTVPLLSPTLLFASIISFIGAFQIFEPMFIITRGGPADSTISLVQDVYYTAFRDFSMGEASAKSLILVGVMLVVTLLQLGLSKKWVNYDR